MALGHRGDPLNSKKKHEHDLLSGLQYGKLQFGRFLQKNAAPISTNGRLTAAS
jgi:hypothetical protein